MSNLPNINFKLALYTSDRVNGQLFVISKTGDSIKVDAIDTIDAGELPKEKKPILIGVTKSNQVVLLDPASKNISFTDTFPADAFPAHDYADPNSAFVWFMNDGDKATGNDTLNCGDEGSSVTVAENVNTANAQFHATTCVGRGHHQCHFCYPSVKHPHVPNYALVSNLVDGTLSVLGNDPEKQDSYLKIVKTINLCEVDKEDNDAPVIPNNAFPHGLVYSEISGKIYNLNNGYGTVAVIDPITLEFEERFNFKGHSNLFVVPGGKYLIGRGADRKSDAEHVIAKLSVFDVDKNEVVQTTQMQDVYISKYFFNPEGTRLYLTTSTSGSDAQLANLKSDVLLVFDLTKLPKISLINEISLGSAAGTLEFIASEGVTQLVVSSNTGSGNIFMLDIDGNMLGKIDVATNYGHSRIWQI